MRCVLDGAPLEDYPPGETLIAGDTLIGRMPGAYSETNRGA
jgi:hypothetical protein